jgi:calpain-15
MQVHAAAVQAIVPWTDPSFPPCAESINGPTRAPKESVAATYIACRCGVPAAKSFVQSDLNGNKGRPYHHCKTRRCQFFAWADGSSISRSYVWKRLPSYVVVTDFGFSPNDLLQGGVGDCWFLSALAVVAQRHDLIARLFVDTAPARSGCYLLRLFLDGQWRHVVVDDQLPCIPNPSRPQLAGEVGLAFSRTCNQQLWVCLLEKAYAKAHGSYHAISGGEISEALVDLCGMPTHTMHFDSPNFNLQDLWTQLLR